MRHNVRPAARRAATTVIALAVLSPLLDGIVPAAAKEKSPPGDIPDDQVFVTYESPLGFSLKVPEGWARTERRDGADFTDKYNTVSMTIVPAGAMPTAEQQAASLVRAGRGVRIERIRNVLLRSGQAQLIVYSADSEPNAVTGKPLRVEAHRYLIRQGDKLAILDFSAPLGADNADQWKLISNAFQWR